MTYRLKVNQQWKIVVALILIPTAFVLLYTGLILMVKNLPGWAILLSVVIILTASIAATMFVIFRWLTVDCEIQLEASGLKFRLLNETPFMQIHEFTCNWENIENTSINEDAENGKIFYSIRFRQPGMTLYLTDLNEKDNPDGQGSDFWKTLNGYVEQHNNSTQSPSLRIGHIGFYDKPWAKVLTYFTLVFYILIVVASVFSGDSRAWLRAVAFSAFALPWLLNYYRAKQKKNKNLPS